MTLKCIERVQNHGIRVYLETKLGLRIKLILAPLFGELIEEEDVMSSTLIGKLKRNF
jgi:hypothetical protein